MMRTSESEHQAKAAVGSLRQDHLTVLDLLRVDADQGLAVGTVDGRLARDLQSEVRMAAGEQRLLERDETAAGRVRTANRQIPFGRRRDVVMRGRGSFSDGTLRLPSRPA